MSHHAILGELFSEIKGNFFKKQQRGKKEIREALIADHRLGLQTVYFLAKVPIKIGVVLERIYQRMDGLE